MKRIQDPDKLYYDVTIDHDPQHKERRYGVASKAETTIDLSEPLIQTPGDFMLSITKFKIDTECIPLMIPEMLQLQDLTRKEIVEQNKMQTKYQVVVRLETLVQQYHTEKTLDGDGNEVIVAENVMDDAEEYNIDIGEYIFLQHHRYSDDNKTKYLGYAKDSDGKVDDTKAFIDNTDEQCFVYSYENFLLGVNLALEKITNDLSENECPEDFKQNHLAYLI